MAPPAQRAAWPGNEAANEAMNRYADGDASAFPVLYDAIAGRLEGFVKRRTREPSRVDDIVQQTFERIHRARGSFIRGSDVMSWAFTIARNLCLDFGVQGWREHGVDGRDGDGTDAVSMAVAVLVDAERAATARQTLARVARAFRSLPAKQQHALELVRLEGFSMAAAAENLGVTVPSIKMSVFRGAAALREVLLEEEDRQRPARNEPSAPTAQDKEHLRGIT